MQQKAAIPEVPADLLEEAVAKAHTQECPKCQKAGPVDIHMSHRVWSLAILTRWYSVPQLSCKSCAVKAQAGSALFCVVAGWWGIPWGLVATPIQILRNLAAMVGGPKPSEPSQELREMVRMNLVENMLHLRAMRETSELAEAAVQKSA